MPGHNGMKPCIFWFWDTDQSLVKTNEWFQLKETNSAFTLKWQEELQICKFLIYSTDKQSDCGERSFPLSILRGMWKT